MGYSYENYVRNLTKSFMLSADNAHAVHPNHSDVADPVNRPYMNEGIVIKYSANQKYCTDAVSSASAPVVAKEEPKSTTKDKTDDDDDTFYDIMSIFNK